MMLRFLIFLAFADLSSGQGRVDFFELPPIKYSETASEDALAKLAGEVARGDLVLPPVGGKEFLRTILEKLGVPEESQVLVFSKTSLQNSLINQRNPRALYFSMDAYVGWVPGGKVEVIIEDDRLGPVFYTIDPPVADRSLRIHRATDSCLQCHATSRTSGVPGMFIRSVVPDQNSHPILSAGTSLVTAATPLKDRWGGWYVTGSSSDPHLGNRWVPSSELGGVEFSPEITDYGDLGALIDTSKYLQSTSDIVALMVLEHQCEAHNLLTKAKMNFLRAKYFQESYGDEGEGSDPRGSLSWKTAESSAREIVALFLFADEVELGGDGVEGGEGFSKAFLQGGVRTLKGKSLRDLRLYGRLFKNRCSYMIYSKAFEGLPPPVKERVFYHLRIALGGDVENHLSARERKILREILSETVPGFKSESEPAAEGR